ncbi:hypothetical protein MTO96_002217 [Rhipicephalus appendiculatus]
MSFALALIAASRVVSKAHCVMIHKEVYPCKDFDVRRIAKLSRPIVKTGDPCASPSRSAPLGVSLGDEDVARRRGSKLRVTVDPPYTSHVEVVRGVKAARCQFRFVAVAKVRSCSWWREP